MFKAGHITPIPGSGYLAIAGRPRRRDSTPTTTKPGTNQTPDTRKPRGHHPPSRSSQARTRRRRPGSRPNHAGNSAALPTRIKHHRDAIEAGVRPVSNHYRCVKHSRHNHRHQQAAPESPDSGVPQPPNHQTPRALRTPPDPDPRPPQAPLAATMLVGPRAGCIVASFLAAPRRFLPETRRLCEIWGKAVHTKGDKKPWQT